jgi:hypothetical protein
VSAMAASDHVAMRVLKKKCAMRMACM